MIEANATIARTEAPQITDDLAAFNGLVDRHYAAVLRFLTRQTGDPDLAADLTQSCFLDAYRCRHQLAAPEAFSAWVFAIARNQVRMEWRRQRLRRLVSIDWLTARMGDLIPALSRDDETASLHDRDRIQQVLEGLSPTLREALLLHDLCGFRGGEVAQILGISAEAARKRIVRAEADFRDRYGAATPPAVESQQP